MSTGKNPQFTKQEINLEGVQIVGTNDIDSDAEERLSNGENMFK